ncbi:plant synaptotagmin [Thecamonas trahens ATCC 50062]|uniref:Plant synaptotagmin n=1 Tax=Thecamonas trahens ATCC 50062 TaxID=461836 RepID=A0A0L0DV66_THETB|nr:plant synaptotagmin [Thecamonas trahens ATCC 50062]KNC56105.1 plant synaptotagmin [Thecamonas trahens ATCC 50062]|eukprot:XP_013761147.1 plant synaptotagmin [Thecamonas trahens ATCC 50062]
MSSPNLQVLREGKMRHKPARNKRFKRFKRGYVVLTTQALQVASKAGGKLRAVLPLTRARAAFHRSHPARFELGSEIAGVIRVAASGLRLFDVGRSARNGLVPALDIPLSNLHRVHHVGSSLSIRYMAADNLVAVIFHVAYAVGKTIVRLLRKLVEAELDSARKPFAVALQPEGPFDKRLVVTSTGLTLQRVNTSRLLSPVSAAATIREAQRRRTAADRAIAKASKKQTRSSRKLRIRKLRKSSKSHKSTASSPDPTPVPPMLSVTAPDSGPSSVEWSDDDNGDGSGADGALSPSKSAFGDLSELSSAGEGSDDNDAGVGAIISHGRGQAPVEFTVHELVHGDNGWLSLQSLSWGELSEIRRIAHDGIALMLHSGTSYVIYFEAPEALDGALDVIETASAASLTTTEASVGLHRSIDDYLDALAMSASFSRSMLFDSAEASSVRDESDEASSAGSGSGFSSDALWDVSDDGLDLHSLATPLKITQRKATRTGVSWDDVGAALDVGAVGRSDAHFEAVPHANAELDSGSCPALAEMPAHEGISDVAVQRRLWIRRVFDGWFGVATSRRGGARVAEELAFSVLYSKYSQGLIHDRIYDFGYTAAFFMLFQIMGWFHFGISWAILGAGAWFLTEMRRREIRERKMEVFAMRAFRNLAFDDPIMQALLNIPNAVDRILPPWVSSPHVHQVEWLNIIVEKMWPYLHVAIEDAIVEKVTPLFEKRPSVVSEVGFASCDFGTIPFLLTGLEIHDSEAEEVLLDLDFRWAGNPDLALWLKAKGVPLTVRFTDFQLYGTFRIGLKPLMQQLPGFGAISVSFAKKPVVDFNLSAGAVSVTHLPGVSAWLNKFIRQHVVATMVWPQKIIKELYSTVEVERAFINDFVPRGAVVVVVHSATSLRKADFFSSDPYASISIDGVNKPQRTRVIKHKTSPVWEERLEFAVPDIAGKRMYVDIFDSDRGINSDDLLGRSEFDIFSLTAYQTVRVSEPLQLAKKGSVTYSVQWCPFWGHPEFRLPPGGVEPSEKYSGILFCHIKKATALAWASSQLWAVASVGHESESTAVSSKANGNKPVWDHKLTLRVDDWRSDVLRVDLFQKTGRKKKKTTATPAGSVKIQVSAVSAGIEGHVLERAFQLDEVAQGAVHLRLIFVSRWGLHA